MKKMPSAILLALFVGHVQAQPYMAVSPNSGAVTNICGRRVVLSYRMPIPNDNPEPDVVTRCFVEEYDQKRKNREFTLPWKLDEFSVVIPKEFAPFRTEGVILKEGSEAGTRRVLYQPKGILFRKRLSMIFDSRDKLRSLDFYGDLQIDLQEKTISFVLSDRAEPK